MAYIISTNPSIENRRAWEDELIEYYLAALKRHGGPSPTVAETRMMMRTQMFTVLSFWTMTLSPGSVPPFPTLSHRSDAADTLDMGPGPDRDSFPEMQKEATTLETLSRIGAAMDDWNVCDVFAELEARDANK